MHRGPTRATKRTRRAAAATLALIALLGTYGARADDPAAPDPGPTPRAHCGPGARPETGAQGRVSKEEIANGRAAQGYACNTEMVGHFGATGGYKVLRYVDAARHECAYFDSTLLFPKDALGAEGPGVFVLDMTDPSHPVKTDALITPAMLSPHESLSLNQKRGLLVADMGYPTTNPGFVDVYDLTADCRHPALKSSTPLGILGHEGNFAPDGNTFYVTSTVGFTVTAVDLTDPSLPSILSIHFGDIIHGVNVSDDGNRLYAANISDPGLTIFDVSGIQARSAGAQMTKVAQLTWPEVSIPQVPIPVTIGSHAYLVEVDEFSKIGSGYDPAAPVGAARIIDIGDEAHPKVVSNIRLEVHSPQARAGDQRDDPGANSNLQGYAGHYCAVPQRAEPGIVACSMILSGLRIFDIRDPRHPQEIGYFNGPIASSSSAYAMSGPTFVPDRGEIWYTDGNSGFYVVRVTNGMWPFAATTTATATPSPAVLAAKRTAPAPGGATLPSTGTSTPLAAGGFGLLGLAAALRLLARRAEPSRRPGSGGLSPRRS